MDLSPSASLPRCTPLLTTLPQTLSANRVLERCETAAFRQRCQPRVERTVALLYRGLRRPHCSLEDYAEQVLMLVAAQRDECPAVSGMAFGAWVSARATQAVLQLYCETDPLAGAARCRCDAGSPSRGRAGRDTVEALR